MTALTLSTSKVFEEVKIENGNSKPGINKGLIMLFAQNKKDKREVFSDYRKKNFRGTFEQL